MISLLFYGVIKIFLAAGKNEPQVQIGLKSEITSVGYLSRKV